jgi:hypothetical protein
MASYKPLSDAAVREISSAYFARREAKTLSRENPTIVMVGGQPGAGKSAAGALARAEYLKRGGFIHVDADRMRERIPIGTSKPTSEKTQCDAGRLVASLRELAIQGRRNIVEEGTFRNADAAAKFIQGMQDKGYRVELVAVATSREESLLGIYQRHEQQHAAGADNPRMVPVAYHDEAMRGFDTTVAKNASLVDRVRVVNRAGETLFDSTSQYNKQGNALEAMVAGRRLPDSRAGEIAKAWGVVEDAAKARGADPAYLYDISRHAVNVQALRDDRCHDHAMSKLDSNVETLGSDSRYAAHTDAELVKTAYWRGYHERSVGFEGIPVDFKLLDKSFADRSTLAAFPGITDLAGYEVPYGVRRHGQVREHDEQGHSL